MKLGHRKNNTKIEEYVIGCLLLNNDNIIEMLDILNERCFIDIQNIIVFRAIIIAYKENNEIDILKVGEILKFQNRLEEIGGYVNLLNYSSHISDSSKGIIYSQILYEKYLQNKIIEYSEQLNEKATKSKNIDEIIEFAENELYKITTFENLTRDAVPLKDVLMENLKEIENASQSSKDFTGIPSGYTSLDRVTLGWQSPDLIILAARPSMGKTSFVANIAYNVGFIFKKPVAFFSLEMSNSKIANKILISDCNLDNYKIQTGKLGQDEWIKLENSISSISSAPIFLNDDAAISLTKLRQKARRLKQKHNIELIIIDYLQLMTLAEKTFSREQEVSKISRGLKALAKDLNIPIIALSQLNRGLENKGDKRPQLSDLRESGAIEQDADIVLFIHRPEKYGISQLYDGSESNGKAEIIIAKNRNGMIGTVTLDFNQERTLFTECNENIFSSEIKPNEDF